MILTNENTWTNRYIRGRIEEYKQKKAELLASDKPIKMAKFHKWIFPCLHLVLKVKSKLCGLTYEFVNENKEVLDITGPVIYAVTHIGKYDWEMVVEACKIFEYVFAGDWELMYATVDDYFLRANGVLWVDTYDKEDRQNSAKYMKKALKQGIPVLIYPEGIWNLTESLPMMKIFPGAVQAAQECQVPIVPIAIEQVEKHFLLNVGDKIDFIEVSEKEAVQILRDTLATLKWEIWETLPQEKRVNIPDGYHEEFVAKRISEFKGFTAEIVDGRRFRDKTEREILEIRKDLEHFGTKR